MAVEARHIINPFPSLPIINRNPMMMKNENNIQEANLLVGRPNSNLSSSQQQIRFMTGNNNYNTTTTTLPEQNHLQHHQFMLSSVQQPDINNNLMMCESQLHHTKMTTESGLTYNNNIPMISRKRLRDDQNNNLTSVPPPQYYSSSSNLLIGEEDFLPQILQQHQYEVDALISQHTKKIRLELAEKHKQQARSIASTINEAMVKRLKEREEQIVKISKINLALQERVKSLVVENQLWRDMAQTNEAAANSLRTNLEQVLLLHVPSLGGEDHPPHVSNNVAVEDDAESCCGSTNGDDVDVDDNEMIGKKKNNNNCYGERRRCKMCGERESCVLVLPCRHLCLCDVCGTGGYSQTVEACPVCNSSMNGTLHVNMPSS